MTSNEQLNRIAASSQWLSSGPIAHYEGDRVFTLQWDCYIGYSVINESFSNGKDALLETPGSKVLELETSVFLDYLSKATFATEEYPGPFNHWSIYCLNHTIDMAAEGRPSIIERRNEKNDALISSACRLTNCWR